MKVIYCGIGTHHAPGAFGRRLTGPNWFFTQFHTNFLYEKDGQLLPGKAGELLIVPPDAPVYHGPANKAEGFVNDWIYFHSPEISQLLQRYPLPLLQPFSPEAAGFRSYLEAIRQEQQSLLPGIEEQLLCLTTQLAIRLHRAVLQHSDSASQRLAAVRRAMLQEPEKPWTLEQLAKESGYSASRFSALYRETFGSSPKQELLQARLQKAEGLLKYGGSTVSQVAEACGFSSLHWFSKYFKAAKGSAPSQYATKTRY